MDVDSIIQRSFEKENIIKKGTIYGLGPEIASVFLRKCHKIWHTYVSGMKFAFRFIEIITFVLF